MADVEIRRFESGDEIRAFEHGTLELGRPKRRPLRVNPTAVALGGPETLPPSRQLQIGP
jgi:hypothetical protein